MFLSEPDRRYLDSPKTKRGCVYGPNAPPDDCCGCRRLPAEIVAMALARVADEDTTEAENETSTY